LPDNIFIAKIPFWFIFLECLGMEIVGFILLYFGIVYGNWVLFAIIRYISSLLVSDTNKNLATLVFGIHF
jgi:hypothetical protein